MDVCEFLEAFYNEFPVPSSFIGVVYVKATKEIQAVINPAHDWQLADYDTEESGVLLSIQLKWWPRVVMVGLLRLVRLVLEVPVAVVVPMQN